MDAAVGAGGGDVECPDAIGGECHEGVLAELALREGTSGGGYALDMADAYGVDGVEGEVEGVVCLGGVELAGEFYQGVCRVWEGGDEELLFCFREIAHVHGSVDFGAWREGEGEDDLLLGFLPQCEDYHLCGSGIGVELDQIGEHVGIYILIAGAAGGFYVFGS